MYLFYDTETTGLPNYRARWSDPDQPHIVQLAALLTDAEGIERGAMNMILKVDADIPSAASDVHGITPEIMEAHGIYPGIAYDAFNYLLACAEIRVAHNAQFDDHLLKIAFTRRKLWHALEHIKTTKPFCTCDAATPIVNLPPTPKMVRAGRHTPKRASLTECHEHFFGEGFEGAHDAMADVRACARVFFELKRLESQTDDN